MFFSGKKSTIYVSYITKLVIIISEYYPIKFHRIPCVVEFPWDISCFVNGVFTVKDKQNCISGPLIMDASGRRGASTEEKKFRYPKDKAISVSCCAVSSL